MRAAVVKTTSAISIEEVDYPPCGNTDIVIKVETCGMCGSDLRIFKHGNKRVTFPAILGHEVAGVVAQVGSDVHGFQVGDRVAMGADIPCGTCSYCVNGICNNCEENLAIGYQYAGGFAEYIKVDKRVWDGGPFVKIPEGVSFAEASVAEPVGCIINGLELLAAPHRKTLLILGSGIIGSLFTEVAPLYGFEKKYVADIRGDRLEFAKSRGFGAEAFLVVDDTFAETVRAITQGKGFDAIVVAVPSAQAQQQSLGFVAKRGAINLFAGLAPTEPPLLISSNVLHYNEVTLTGSHGSTPVHHRTAMELIANKKINVKKAITHEFSLADMQKGLDVLESLSGLKVIIYPHG